MAKQSNGQAIKWLGNSVHRVPPQSMTDTTPGPQADRPGRGWSELDELDLELNRLQRELRRTIEATLVRFAGRKLGDLSANRQLAETIGSLLDRHGLRVCCPECGHPAIMRVSPRPTAPEGVFVFDHTIAGRRTFHGGGGTMPELKLVAKPPRRLKRRAAG